MNDCVCMCVGRRDGGWGEWVDGPLCWGMGACMSVCVSMCTCCRGSTLNMAKPGPEHILVNCKHIFEQDKQPSYVSVLVLLLSLRYYINLWNPIGS